MCQKNHILLNSAMEDAQKRVNIKNEGNGYAYLMCSVRSKKKKYCVL